MATRMFCMLISQGKQISTGDAKGDQSVHGFILRVDDGILGYTQIEWSKNKFVNMGIILTNAKSPIYVGKESNDMV